MDDGPDDPRTPRWRRTGRIGAVPAGALDTAWVLAFVVIGRSSHSEGERLAGIARTAWPFLLGLAAGWAMSRAWRAPAALVPTGAVAWPVCVAVGMVLRVASGQGVVPAFVGVALAFVGLGLLGWRALALLWAEHGSHRADSEGAPPARGST